MNSKIIPIAIAALLAVATCCSAKDLTPDKLRKSYEKINEYLEKSVKTDDPEINMAHVAIMLQEQTSKCTLLCGASLIRTLQMLRDLSNMPEVDSCDLHEEIRLIEKLDSGLVDKSKANTENYPVSRVEKMISHFALKKTLRCDFGGEWPKTAEYAYKRRAYDAINNHLVDALPEEQNIDANMNGAKKLLDSLELSNGALALALKQFLGLKSTLNEESCNQVGFETLLSNDLATRGNAHSWYMSPMRRVDRIFRYYSKKHEEICRPIFVGKIGENLKRLDEETYHRVLALASSKFVTTHSFETMVKRINEKQVDSDFPIMQEVSAGSGFQMRAMKNSYLLANSDGLQDITVFLIVQALSSGDPESKYLKPLVDERKGTKYVNEEKVEWLLNKYLFNPCSKFIETFEELIKLRDYGWLQTGGINDNSIEETTARFVQHAHATCKTVLAKRNFITESSISLAGGHAPSRVIRFNRIG